MIWYWSAREKDGAWNWYLFSNLCERGVEYVSWLVTWSRSLCRSPVRPKLPTLPAVTKTWVLWRSMVMSHKGSGFDFMDNTWTSPHSHLCQAGRAKVCRGGDQRPNTLSLKVFLHSFQRKKRNKPPNAEPSELGPAPRSSNPLKLRGPPETFDHQTTFNNTRNGQYPRKTIIEPRKKWSDMLKVLSPWRARIIPPCREAWSVMSLVTGRFACWNQNWNDQEASELSVVMPSSQGTCSSSSFLKNPTLPPRPANSWFSWKKNNHLSPTANSNAYQPWKSCLWWGRPCCLFYPHTKCVSVKILNCDLELDFTIAPDFPLI